MNLLRNFSLEQKRFIGLSSLSSGLEYYDFVMFVIFAKAISENFFAAVAWLNLLATFAVFAVGYFGRPLGAILFGHLGDRFGRKQSFLTTAILMAFASLGIGLLPGYATWGVMAPILLVLLRLVQGLSLGGELSGSLVYSIELAPKMHRAFTTSLIFLGMNFGILLAYGISFLLTHSLAEDALNGWGWRIAFILGGFIGIINFYLRRILRESPVFVAQAQSEKIAFPLVVLLKTEWQKMLQGIGLVMMGAISNVIVFYMPTYLMVYFQIPLAKILLVNTINILILTLEQLFLGRVADKIGRKPLLILCALCYLLFSYPLFHSLAAGHFNRAVIVLVVFALLNGLASSSYPSMLAELFPTRVRYSGFAISYNIAFTIFAGLTPAILTYFIHLTGHLAFPGIYFSALGILALVAVMFTPETYRRDL